MLSLLVGLNFLLLPPSLCNTYIDLFDRSPDYKDTCIEVVKSALVHQIDPVLVLATCEEETKCRPGLVSRVGARGPLQTLDKYWCSKDHKPCDRINAGVRALKLLRTCRTINFDKHVCNRFRKRPLPWSKVLCHYNGGNVCGSRSRSYAKRVLSDLRKIRRSYGRPTTRLQF